MQTAFHETYSPAAGLPPFDVEGTRARTHRDDALVEAHWDQVWHVARSLARRLPPTIDVEDLVGAGSLGLLAAADRFEPGRGITFKTYAESRIRGAMLDYLRQTDWAPRRLRKAQRSLRAAEIRLEGHGLATDDDLARELGLSLDEYQNLRGAIDTLSLLSYDATPCPETGFAGSAAAPAERSPLAEYERAEMRERLAAAIDRLPARERQIISLSFVEDLSLKEIGGIFGVTESRVSQIRTQALRLLRQQLES